MPQPLDFNLLRPSVPVPIACTLQCAFYSLFIPYEDALR